MTFHILMITIHCLVDWVYCKYSVLTMYYISPLWGKWARKHTAMCYVGLLKKIELFWIKNRIEMIHSSVFKLNYPWHFILSSSVSGWRSFLFFLILSNTFVGFNSWFIQTVIYQIKQIYKKKKKKLHTAISWISDITLELNFSVGERGNALPLSILPEWPSPIYYTVVKTKWFTKKKGNFMKQTDAFSFKKFK